MSEPILQFDAVDMTFPAGDGPPRQVLREVSFNLPVGQSIALVGRSGSGKSTLLHLAAGISTPSAGRITLYGSDLTAYSERERTHLRGQQVGLVFQFFHLLTHLSVAENVVLPGWIAGEGGRDLRKRAEQLLAKVGMHDRCNDPVGQLSGGEMQRVAICRALLRRPALVLADEPTGSLDEEGGQQVMDLLHEMVRAENGTLLFVTHNRDLAATADAVWELHQGRLHLDPLP